MAEKKIMTACGPIRPEELGLTSMHDHILFDGSVLAKRMRADLPEHKLPIHENDKVSLENVGMLQRNTILAWDALNHDDEAVMEEEVALFKRAGGGAMLDLTVVGDRYDVGAAAAKRISQATGVHVIMSTGFYTGDSWPNEMKGQPIRFYYEYMLKEIKEGVQGTDVMPGHLKIGMEQLNEDEENALRAAARVANETGLALTIHPCEAAGGDNIRIINILKEEGVDLERVVIAHANFTHKPSFRQAILHPEDYYVDTDLAKRTLDSGVNISKEFLNVMGLELLGRYDGGDWSEMSGLVKLIDEGYCDQIVIGNDVCAKVMLHQSGGTGFCRMLYYTLPMLRDVAGVADYALRAMFYNNPARILQY
ncbi:phosphotriesterase [Christensenellaceae bacterium OttesenSCG-928-M15]|nr:phosphotriesterase [Christensenellaceae bacterium OttesenSCG-928-M15]